MIEFAGSGVETFWWLPVLVAFLVSILASVGGLSGAFLLMPFQISIFGFAGPAASSTNLLFNIFAIPGGVYRHYRENRMIWSLAWGSIIGLLPGMFIGAIIRIKFLPDTETFKIFAGLVLLYLVLKLLYDMIKKGLTGDKKRPDKFSILQQPLNLKEIKYRFNDQPVRVPTIPLILLSFAVGVVGGTYGIGGGAIIVPFLVAVYRVPVHTIAGAALLSTFVASIAGVLFYMIVPFIFSVSSVPINPDWQLGGLMGIGGFAGIYIGSRIQKFLPAGIIKAIIILSMLLISLNYLFIS